MFVVHDGVSMAHMGRPFAPYLSLGIFLSCSIDLGSPMVFPGEDPIVFGFFHVPPRKAEGRLREVALCFSCPIVR